VTSGVLQLIEFPQSEISTWGGGVVFLNVLLTRLGVPIPAVPVLLFAGSAIASGALSFWYVLPAAVVGALIGDGIWFTAGRRYGQRLINALSRLSMSAGAHVRTARSLFERFGAPIVSVSKFIPGLGIATPPLMGTTRVDPKIFFAWDLLGASVWATFWLLGGAVFEKQLHLFVVAVRAHGATVIDLVLAASLLYFVYRCIQRLRRPCAPNPRQSFWMHDLSRRCWTIRIGSPARGGSTPPRRLTSKRRCRRRPAWCIAYVRTRRRPCESRSICAAKGLRVFAR
jgi:membrane protein DedA with SNARE-associated domain